MGGQTSKAKITHYALPEPLVVAESGAQFLSDAPQSIKDAYASGVRVPGTATSPFAFPEHQYSIFDDNYILTLCQLDSNTAAVIWNDEKESNVYCWPDYAEISTGILTPSLLENCKKTRPRSSLFAERMANCAARNAR